MNNTTPYENELGPMTYKGYLSKIERDKQCLIYSNKNVGEDGYFTKIIDCDNEVVTRKYSWETFEEMCENHLRIKYETETFYWVIEE